MEKHITGSVLTGLNQYSMGFMMLWFVVRFQKTLINYASKYWKGISDKLLNHYLN